MRCETTIISLKYSGVPLNTTGETLTYKDWGI